LILNACIFVVLLVIFVCSAITDVVVSAKIINKQKNELTIRSN
jgi:hypothetical protein